MEIYDIRSPQWADAEHTLINAEILIEKNGEDWLPTTLVDSGDKDHIHDAFQRCSEGKAGDIADYVEPEFVIEDHPLDRIQFEFMLIMIDKSMGDVEAAIKTSIEGKAQQAMALAQVHNVQTFHRNHPLFDLLTPAMGLTSEELDDLWKQALAAS